MTHPSETRSDASTRGPERFAAPVAPEARPSWAKALGALVALAALLVGIPALLWLLTGPPPVPTGLPSRDDLTQPVGTDVIIVVLRAVVWLAWLQFAVCTVVEVVSFVRGGALPPPVPLAGRSQALARALVGTILIGTSVLGMSVGAAAAASPTPVDTVASSAMTVQQMDDRAAADDAVEEEGDRGQRMEHVPGVPADMTDVIGHKVAIVEPPRGHYHDNLWDIAERTLDDGRRWKEIYDLNKGRVQPDGGGLVLGRLIQPGWVLIMPGDAKGLPTVHALDQERVAPDAGPRQEGPETALDVLRDATEQAGSVSANDSEGARSMVGPFVQGGLLAAVLFVGLMAERRRRRGLALTDDEIEAEVALRLAANDDRVQRLDRALRGLSATCRAERIPLPQVYVATVDDDAIELRIAPPVPSAPAPWSALDEGRRWRLERDAEETAGSGHAPYPGLVCLGRDDSGADLLVDLESVGGVLAIGGSDTVAREVVSALAVQLATAPWADEQVVHAYDLTDVLGEVAGSPLAKVDDLGALLRSWSTDSPRRDAQSVLSGRLGRHPGVPPQYLVLGSGPADDDTLTRLAGLTSAGARGIGVVSAVPLPAARWRLRVDDTGRLSIPLLDLEVDAVRLTSAAAEVLGELFAKARHVDPVPIAGRQPVPQPSRTGDDSHWRTAEVRVGVLGPLEVIAPGPLDPSRLELATELAVFLALQSAPVHPSVVGASVWPRGVTPEVRDATIARVRDWLGTDADGSHLLRESPEGRIYLADSVAADWHAFCTLAGRSREAGVGEERELLRRALQLVRGPLLAGRPSLRYAWLPRTRLERQAEDVLVDAAHRLAELSLDDDPSGAAAACRAGLRLAPTSQLLWRDLLLAESRDPNGPGTAATVDEMAQQLQTAGVPIEPETEALVVELLPDRPDQEGGVSA